jgi:hypothetical protein
LKHTHLRPGPGDVLIQHDQKRYQIPVLRPVAFCDGWTRRNVRLERLRGGGEGVPHVRRRSRAGNLDCEPVEMSVEPAVSA